MAKKRTADSGKKKRPVEHRTAKDQVQEVERARIPEHEVEKPLKSLPSEYETIRSKIAPHVRDSPLWTLSSTNIKTLSREIAVPIERLEELVAADKLAHDTRLPAELFFGLSRQGLPRTLESLLKEDPKQFREALSRAIESRQISRLEGASPGAVNRLITFAIDRTPVSTLLTHLGLEASKKLKSVLRAEGITTLAELRNTGGLSFREGLSESDRAVAGHLDAQARLLTLHPDPTLTAKLVNNGYSSIASIAQAEPSELAAAIGREADAPIVKGLITRGKAQHGLVQSVSFGLMGSQATGLQTIDEWAANHPIYSVVSETCSCKDCDAAVSPRAYLADLMQYAIDHLRDGGQAVDLGFFESHFYQPFGKLPANCRGMEEEVRQVRVCIEVLRAYLGQRPLADAARESSLKEAEQRYRVQVYQVILNKLGTNLTELRLAQGATLDERKSIAERIGISDAALSGMYFDPSVGAMQLTEQALEREFGLVDTTQPPLRNVPTAIFTNARRFVLRETWKLQDWARDEYVERKRPIVDPDILGPDDFRAPYRKANAADLDRAFDLWVVRREWADVLLQRLRTVPSRQSAGVAGPDFVGIVGTMWSVPYHGRAPQWPANSLTDMKTQLSRLTADNTDDIVQYLNSNYLIALDAARRLIELWEKDSMFWRNPQRAPQLDEMEWRDLFAILLRVVKNAHADFWVSEEIESAELRAQANEIRRVWVNTLDASQALLGSREFWKAVAVSTEGDWPPIRNTGVPLIDPELVKREELPEPVAGRKRPGLKDTRTIWDERATELRDKQRALAQQLETADFDAVIIDALGPVPAPATSWSTYLHTLDQDLSGTNATNAAAATQTIEQTLRLTVEGFQRFVNVMDAQAGLGGRTLPSQAELSEAFSLLVSAWKVRIRYAQWVTIETDAITGFEPWRCRRHALPKWRATVEERQQWQRALSLRGRPPLIDPDLLTSVAYMKTPGSGSAWTLWNQRRNAISVKFQALQVTGRTITELNQLADAELGPNVLTELVEAVQSGKAVGARLQQVNLSFNGFKELLRVRALLSTTPAQPVLDAEWDVVSSILTQVWKERQCAEWGLEERLRDVFLSPVVFQLIPIDFTEFPPPPSPQLDVWRASTDVLLDWEDRLQSRIDQDREVAEAVEQAVSEAEEQCLPALRDAILAAAAPTSLSFKQAARWVGDHLAIATEYGGCQKTTRISQAIETFQGILWGIRTGILLDQYPNFRLIGENFDEEWKWIGSYAMWRAAMFVLLYPENLLLPSLRRVQTPAFRELVDELRGGRRLTPVRARQVAERYAAYFRDVCTLELKATCKTITATPTGDRELQYLFAVGGESGAVYWCMYDPGDQTGHPLSFWTRIEGLTGKTATIVGTDSFRIFTKRYLYLFLIVESEGNRELAFTRFDLRTRTWAPETTPLKPPRDVGTFTAALIERLDEHDPPTLAIKASDGTFFQRFLNQAGLDWGEGDWVPRDRVWRPWQSPIQANTDNAATQANASNLKSGSRFFASHTTDPNVVYFACLGQDGQVYGFRLNNYFLPPRLQSFNVPGFVGVLGSDGGITGIARNALLPNSQTVMPQIDLFVVANDQSIRAAHWDLLNGWASNQWSRLGYLTHQALANSIVAVTARHSNIIDVFFVDTHSIVNKSSWGRETGYTWEVPGQIFPPIQIPTGQPTEEHFPPAPFPPAAIPDVTALTPTVGRVDLLYNVFSISQTTLTSEGDFQVLLHYWSKQDRSDYAAPYYVPDSKDVAHNAHVTGIVRTRNSFDIFVPRTAGGIWTARRVLDAGWSKWEQIGERSTTFPATPQISALTRSANRVLAFAIDEHGKLDSNGQPYGFIQSSWQRDGANVDKWYPWAPVNFPPTVTFKPGSHVASVMSPPDPLSGRITIRVSAIDTTGVLRWTESLEELPVRPVDAPSFAWKPALWAGVSVSDLVITEQLYGSQRLDRPIEIKAAYVQNSNGSKSISTYLEEMFYFIPLHIALELQKSGAYIAALDWFKLVYDYTAQPAFRRLVGMPPESPTASDGFIRNVQNWLLDPLNPHSIALTRRNTYARFTLMAIIRCLLEYADKEFTQDSPETVPVARELYEEALTLLTFSDLKQGTHACEEAIGELNITLNGAGWQAVSSQIYAAVQQTSSLSELKATVKKLNTVFARATSDEKKYASIRPILDDIASESAKPVTYAHRMTDAKNKTFRMESAVLAREDVAVGIATVLGKEDDAPLAGVFNTESVTMNSPTSGGVGMPTTLAFDFCVPANPVLRALRLRADLNLYKINHCRNIAGLERQLDAFAALTDTTSGMPVIGAGGQLAVPGATPLQPTVYRYAVLIDRAKQLVQQAIQIESAFLAALEKSDKEAYDLLTARSNVRLAQAGVRLQDLQMLEAQDGVRASELQRDRAQIQVKTYEDWINQGLTPSELSLLGWYDWLAVFQIISVNLGALMQGITGGMQIGPVWAAQIAFQAANAGRGVAESLAISAQREISRLNVMIGFERRLQEFTLQKTLADQDVLIGEQQIVLANDHVRITEQERVIEQLKADQAKEVLDFLSNKFTNKELYDWMSNVLEEVYSVLLQQATSMAKLATDQLAFERQEPRPAYIQGDYWEASADDTGAGEGGQPPDRRGLTGSARLLQDISQLDQYAFETNRRKQPLTKVISLAQHDPLAFQRFLETGQLPFVTPMELFDRDFPGHYLRLIKRVRTSVVALIPPTFGIRATLTASGLSRVVIGGDVFQTITVRRSPEVVSLSAPANSSGVSELQEPPEMLLPFEGHGVATSWEFALPKAANPFDFATIADVLISIEYTSLLSFDYRQQIVQTLNAKRTVSQDRAFSFRHYFADAWYDLNNPDLTTHPMSVSFQTVREDFPPNIESVRIEHVTLYFSRKSGRNIEFDPVDLRLTQSGGGLLGGTSRTDNGLISTRSGNGASWLGMKDATPFGQWQLTLSSAEEVKQRFQDEDIKDILLIVTYAGRLPEWPL